MKLSSVKTNQWLNHRTLRQLFSVCVLWAGMTAAQTGNDWLSPVQTQLDQAKAARAELLAPKSYARAQSELSDLTQDVNKQAKTARLQKQQQAALQAAQQVTTNIAQSNKTLQTVIRAYDDAVTAGAPNTQGEAWQKAAERFNKAVAEVEGNDLDDARSRGAEAEVLLRDVELAAIKNNVLGEARAAVAKDRDAKVPEVAPRSFAVAEQQLSLAEQQLSRSRYDLAEPTKLAAQAVYEARHAKYLADLINAAQSKDGVKQQIAEQQWLALEPPLTALAGEVSVAAKFDAGYQDPLQEVTSSVQKLQQELIDARQETRDREQDITDLKTQLADTSAAMKKLEIRLGGESEERMELQKKLSAQERLRNNINQVEAMFTTQEGQVYRQGNELVMSLTGINFRVGKSTIEPASFPILAKIAEAYKLFPNATLTIEGHTDNQGSDSANLLLSQDRADAVKQYLVSNLAISAEKISSIGYGESKPVTSNDTEAGRTRNRRIDVVMNIGGQ